MSPPLGATPTSMPTLATYTCVLLATLLLWELAHLLPVKAQVSQRAGNGHRPESPRTHAWDHPWHVRKNAFICSLQLSPNRPRTSTDGGSLTAAQRLTFAFNPPTSSGDLAQTVTTCSELVAAEPATKPSNTGAVFAFAAESVTSSILAILPVCLLFVRRRFESNFDAGMPAKKRSSRALKLPRAFCCCLFLMLHMQWAAFAFDLSTCTTSGVVW